MNITAEEKLMYEVMKAVYEGGIPISFKGSMVMKACLLEAGYDEDTRHTVDIDANWNTDYPPSPEQMVDSLQNALEKNSIDLDVSIYRMYGERQSAGFELKDKSSGEVIFTMDVDVNRPIPQTKIYEISGIRFIGVSPVQIIADKASAISSGRIYRRIKDVVDLFYLSQVFEFDKGSVLQAISASGRTLYSFEDFLNGQDALKHSYEKFRFAGGVNKPPFEEVYNTVKEYLSDILP